VLVRLERLVFSDPSPTGAAVGSRSDPRRNHGFERF
jgi:hypothetical protein